MIDVLPFGGCGLHNPLGAVSKKTNGPNIFGSLRIRGKMFSLSANTNLQLVDFVAGDSDFPVWIKELMYGGTAEKPSSDKRSLIYSCDIAIVELSTPIELNFDGALLNINRFEEAILSRTSKISVEKKLISRWKSALLKGDEEVRRSMAKEIHGLIPKDTPEDQDIAKFVLSTASRMLSVEEQTKSVADLRDRLGMPVGMILHNFSFMPDGRSVSWPAGFKDSCAEVAKRLDLPTFDFASHVKEAGVATVMLDDLRHWAPGSYLRLGELMHDFCDGVLDGQGKSRVRTRATDQTSQTTAAGVKTSSGGAPSKKPERLNAMASLDEELRRELAELLQDDGAPSAAPTAGPLLSAPQYYQFDSVSGGHLRDSEPALLAVVVLGSAWAMGMNNDPEDKVVSELSSHTAGALMFNAGVRAAGKDVKAFVQLQEQGGSFAKETPCAGIADQVIRNSWSRFRRRPEMLFFAVGRRATSLSGAGQTGEDGLLRGSVQHREVTRLVARARDIAAGQKLRLEVAAICLLHGEYEAGRNVSGSAYRRGLSMLQLQYDADIRAMTGQSEPVRLYLTQTNRGVARFEPPEIPIAQLNAGRDNPYVQCVGPTYFAAPEARTEGAAAYVKAAGYRRIGQLFGRFLLDDLWGGQREPLRVEEAYWTGPKTVRLRYNRPVSLEEDDARVNISALGPGLGVDFNDGAPWSPTVESVRATRGREAELDVELTAPPTGPRKRVLIATRTTGAGGVGCLEGARSAIRSKEPFDTDPIDDAELFDWACSEQINLP